MLNKSKLIAELQRTAHELFIDTTDSYRYAQAIWQTIITDPLFIYKVKEVTDAPWPIPTWNDALARIIPIAPITSHLVLSVDGSQIYPDRHTALSCFLINIGSIALPYLCHNSHRVELYSEPIVFTEMNSEKIPCTTDMVNAKRQELELKTGLMLHKTIKNKYEEPIPSVLLFDGSLIFWHLSSKETTLRDHFLNEYIMLLDQLYQEKAYVAWYISMPKSKELVNLIRLYLSDFKPCEKERYEQINTVLDSTIMQSFLPPHTRTIIFHNNSSITAFYPQHLKPCFFYIHNGAEIGRVELPYWMARDETIVDLVASIILDQCTKGCGYPVALAEAHEQAVIKGPDRDFFYHVLQKMCIERKQMTKTSQKSLKKRGLGI